VVGNRHDVTQVPGLQTAVRVRKDRAADPGRRRRAAGAELAWLDLTPDGRIDLDTLSVITPNTRLVAFTHVSNVLGTRNDIKAIAKAADEGLQADGSMVYERWTDTGKVDTQRQWWVMCSFG